MKLAPYSAADGSIAVVTRINSDREESVVGTVFFFWRRRLAMEPAEGLSNRHGMY